MRFIRRMQKFRDLKKLFDKSFHKIINIYNVSVNR